MRVCVCVWGACGGVGVSRTRICFLHSDYLFAFRFQASLLTLTALNVEKANEIDNLHQSLAKMKDDLESAQLDIFVFRRDIGLGVWKKKVPKKEVSTQTLVTARNWAGLQ